MDGRRIDRFLAARLAGSAANAPIRSESVG
jgi:hypothetical protein